MSTLSALGSRLAQAPAASALAQLDGRGAPAQKPTKDSDATPAPVRPLNPVALSGAGIDLSTRLGQRDEQLGGSTVDVAQGFLNRFARQYLGAAGKGASVSFDSARVSASSDFSASLGHSEGADGVTDAAAFSYSESSHFIGKGTITTADGQSFNFEIEVQYNLQVEGSASQVRAAPDGPAPADGPPPKRQLPDIDFPGGLGDLFKLLGREIKAAPPDDGEGKGGNLTLRLLKLVNTPTSLDAGAPQIAAATRAKALADTYGANAA